MQYSWVITDYKAGARKTVFTPGAKPATGGAATYGTLYAEDPEPPPPTQITFESIGLPDISVLSAFMTCLQYPRENAASIGSVLDNTGQNYTGRVMACSATNIKYTRYFTIRVTLEIST